MSASAYDRAERAGCLDDLQALEAERDALREKVDQLKDCLRLFTMQCEEMHHERGQQHGYDEPCPVVAKVRDALEGVSEHG